jgi:peptide/nickel transport system substrate-binding protein
VIRIDQLKEIYIDAVLEPVETANLVPKIYRKGYTIAINRTESGVDGPDQQFYENFVCGRCATTPVIAIRRLTS